MYVGYVMLRNESRHTHCAQISTEEETGYIYRSLPKKGPWEVYVTLGGWADITGIRIEHYKVLKVVQITRDIVG